MNTKGRFLSNCFWAVAYFISAILFGFGLAFTLMSGFVSGPPVGIGFLICPWIAILIGGSVGVWFC